MKVSAQVRNDLPLAETKTSIATTEKEHSPTVIAAPIPAVNVWRVRKSTKTCDNENKTSGADMTTDAPAPLTDDAAWPAPQEVLEEGQQQQQPKFVIPKGKKSQWKPYTPTITHSTPTPTGLRLRTAASRGRGQGERRKTRRNSHPGLRQQADESVAPGSLSATMARAETSTTTAPPPASIAVNVKPAAAASTPTTTSSTSTASITHSPSRASHSTPVIYSQLNTGERGTGYAGGRSGSSRGRGNGRGTYRRYNEHRIKPQLMNMDADTLKHYLLQQM
ncbi:hypothetical protein BX666DRAFT_1148584 [Dichotomocladium elegans]|nr:hypothetical protein BX666DRAFT_1148584 [Dichotomocladium elegans]